VGGAVIWVVVKKPGLPATVERTEGQLADLHRLIGRTADEDVCIDVFAWTPDVHVYCDDEGLRKELPVNFMCGLIPIVGTVVFSRIDFQGEEIGFVDEARAVLFAAAFNSRVTP
jgi:hypothetical protein